MVERVFLHQTTKNNNFSKDGYPYTGIISWDIETLGDIVKKAKKNNSLPVFGLKRVELHPTSTCQYRCPFCYGVNFKCKQKIDLPLEIIENNIFKSIKNNKLSKSDPIIILAGLYSEPLFHSNIIGLIKLLGKYNFRFGIYTNGGFLDDNIARVICESSKQNKSKRPSYISFNIVASIIHGYYNILERKIKNFIKTRDSMNAPVQVNIPILLDGNLSESALKELQKKLLQIGVDKIRYSIPQTPVSDNKIDIKNIKFINSLRDKNNKNKGNIFVRSISGKQFDQCYVLANTVCIDHKGAVYPCSQTCSDYFRRLSYGSIKKQKLIEIWNSEKHKKIFTNFGKISTYCRCNLSDQQFNTVCSFIN